MPRERKQKHKRRSGLLGGLGQALFGWAAMPGRGVMPSSRSVSGRVSPPAAWIRLGNPALGDVHVLGVVGTAAPRMSVDGTKARFYPGRPLRL